jgi:hypothetical protein
MADEDLSRLERARFVGGPEDGQRVIVDHEGDELPRHVVADGGDAPVGYRLVPGEEGAEWVYVVDQAVADAFLEQLREKENDDG